MEPDSLKELLTNSITETLQQKPYTKQSQIVQELLKAAAALSMVSDDHNMTDWLITNKVQQYTWDDYNEELKEEIEDNDLGLVRKINLN